MFGGAAEEATRMFAKLALLVVAIGAGGCSLLALRQQRLQVASELTRAQLRIQAADERLWELRARIALHTTPHAVRVLANDLGPMKPVISIPTGLPADWVVADGREVLPIVPRLNEPAGAPRSRSARATVTPSSTPATVKATTQANAPAKKTVAPTPSPTRTAQTPATRRAEVASTTKAKPPARSTQSTKSPAKSDLKAASKPPTKSATKTTPKTASTSPRPRTVPPSKSTPPRVARTDENRR